MQPDAVPLQTRGQPAKAGNEATEYAHFQYVVINKDLDGAVAEVSAIVRAERRRVPRCGDEVRRILDTFPERP